MAAVTEDTDTMGIFDFIKGQLLEIIEWTDDSRDTISYRFPDDASEKVVREIWGEIVEGRSSLWRDIGDDKKECIRGRCRLSP